MPARLCPLLLAGAGYGSLLLLALGIPLHLI